MPLLPQNALRVTGVCNKHCTHRNSKWHGDTAGLVTTTADLGKSPTTSVQSLIRNSQLEKALKFLKIYFFISLAPKLILAANSYLRLIFFVYSTLCEYYLTKEILILLPTRHQWECNITQNLLL